MLSVQQSSLDRVDLPAAFRHAASGAWVITSAHRAAPVGFTAISVVSVSVDPPLISFNLGLTSSSRAAIEASGSASLHLLTAGQEDVARRFAGDRSRRFADDGTWGWHRDGLPTLRDYTLRLSTRVVGYHEAGDSQVVLARVTGQTVRGGRPLVHHRGGFSGIGVHATGDSAGTRATGGSTAADDGSATGGSAARNAAGDDADDGECPSRA